MQERKKFFEALGYDDDWNEGMYKILKQLIAYTSDTVAGKVGIVDGPLKEEMDDCLTHELVDAYWSALKKGLEHVHLDELMVRIEE